MRKRRGSAWICLLCAILLGVVLPRAASSQEEPEPGSFEDRIAELFPAVHPKLPVQSEFEEDLEPVDGREVPGYRRVIPEGEAGEDFRVFYPIEYGEPWILESNDILLRLLPLAPRQAWAGEERGKIAYRDQDSLGQELIVVKNEGAVHLLLLEAPSFLETFDFLVVECQGAEPVAEDGAVHFVAPDRRRLTLSAPLVLDATGAVSRSAARWELKPEGEDGPAKLTLTVETAGLTPPLLVDHSWSAGGDPTAPDAPSSLVTPIMEVVIFDSGMGSPVSYLAGSETNLVFPFKVVLDNDPETRFFTRVVRELTRDQLQQADVLFLPDNAVPDAYLQDVAAWFEEGDRGIVGVDSAANYLAYSGYLWPEAEGTNGYNVYWNYQARGYQHVDLRECITSDYQVGDLLQTYIGQAAALESALPPDATVLTSRDGHPMFKYVVYRDIPAAGSRVVLLGPYGYDTIPDVLHSMIREAVASSSPGAYEDSDGDGVPDCEDNCVDTPNPAQKDCDGDLLGDACDPDANDADGDGVDDQCDNCPDVVNEEQVDTSGDGIGDACNDAIDRDGDEWEDGIDNCPDAANPDQADTSGDGIGDICNDDVDQDGDEWEDGVDNCPDVANPGQENRDGDAFGDACDNCPDLAGDDPTDTDADGRGDRCDNCPLVPNPGQEQSDGDEPGDACDNCPSTTNPGQEDWVHPNELGDACDDPDADGVFDDTDNCPDTSNPDQANSDRDSAGDACDPYDVPLIVYPEAPRYALTDGPVTVSFRLEDSDGVVRSDFVGVRITLTLDGSAVFGSSASQGQILDGAGTGRALVEFHEGYVTLEVNDADAELVTFGGQDTESIGIGVIGDLLEDFEADDGGFTHSGSADPWQWGHPNSGPGQAYSGARLWATLLNGNYYRYTSASLYAPPVRLPSNGSPRLTVQSWHSFSYGSQGSVELAVDGSSWTSLGSLSGYQTFFTPRSFDLSAYAGSRVHIRFFFYSNYYYYTAPGWYLDDFALEGMAETLDFLLAGADEDGDGVSNSEELEAGSDPRDPDTDDDEVSDLVDNCLRTANPGQADDVHPNGIGDACDDPDEDGVFDDVDNCPDTPNPDQTNSDRDAPGDACDPYPANLLVFAETPEFGLTDRPTTITYRLEDDTGVLRDDFEGVRFTLTLGGSAVFGGAATQGVLLEGGGTNRALVEFVDGFVTLEAHDSVAEVVALDGEDTEWHGIWFVKDMLEDFELSDGGFTHSGTNDSWELGEPVSGPGAAFSGTQVWATNLEGNYPGSSMAYLSVPVVSLPGGSQPRLEFQSWLWTYEYSDRGYVQVSRDGTAWDTLWVGYNNQSPYRLISLPLDNYAGSPVWIRFYFYSDGDSGTAAGWYLDDVAIVGLGPSGTRSDTEFLEPDSDLDEDGVTAAEELELGTDPYDPDSDHDGIGDGIDNCPLTANADQADGVHPNGAGDACDDPDEDGVFDREENCPDTPNPDQADTDADGTGDACNDAFDTDGDEWSDARDNCPEDPNGGQEDQDGDQAGDLCDPYPETALFAVIESPRFALTGVPRTIRYRLEDQDGNLRDDLEQVRTTLTVGGSAFFDGSADEGALLSGGGTGRAVVEFEQGYVSVSVSDATAEIVSLSGDDTERVGIIVVGEVLEDFELSDGGFTHSGYLDEWEHGVPTAGPGRAFSGDRVWATDLDSSYNGYTYSSLESRSYPIPAGARPRLSFQRWSSLGYYWSKWGVYYDYAWVEVVGDDGQQRTLAWWIGHEGGYHSNSFDLSDFGGAEIRVRFVIAGQGGYPRAGLYIDDFLLTGMAPSLEFLDGDADLDGDGLSNAAELELGSNPHHGDSDGDAIADADDNCPLVMNADQADEVHPNETGDACEDPDGDEVVDLTDNCPDDPNDLQWDCDQDGRGDVCDADTVDGDADQVDDLCDNCTEKANYDQANSEGDAFGDLCDNCPSLYSNDGTDTDGDGAGNPCDADDDNDAVLDESDNCPLTANPDQADFDADVVGDACDNCRWIYNPRPQTLHSLLESLEANHTAIAERVPDRFDFYDGVSGSYISDGGSDMYDGGNGLNTSLRNGISYSDRAIVDGSGAFGPGSSYFTAKYQGLWVLAVADLDVESFWVSGNLGADGSGSADGTILYLESRGRPFTVFVKRVFGAGDPSVNHLVIVPGHDEAVTHRFSTYTDDDFHAVENLTRVRQLYYILVARSNGLYLADEDAEAVALEFLAQVSAKVQPDEDGDGFGDACDHRPVADAGPDLVLECEAELQSEVALDGSGSHDPDSVPPHYDDLAFHDWSEAGELLAEGVRPTISLSLGEHVVDLTVTDHAGASDEDAALVTVEDTLEPYGEISFPPEGSCHGTGVTVLDAFADQCDPELARSYAPDGGPVYAGHGDHAVTLTVADDAGLTAADSVAFTVDLVSPGVELLPPAPGVFDVPIPSTVELDEAFRTDDDADGAAGGVIHEILYWDGCRVFDGNDYGDGDGLLVDEAVPVHQSTLCRVRHLCGVSSWSDPVLRVEAYDCGGNMSSDETVVTGSWATRPEHCVSNDYQVDSLWLEKTEEGLRLSWSVAPGSDGTALYRVWRRALGQEVFDLLTELPGLSYVDREGLTGDFEYEVTAIE